ncbi:MAG TPA: DUF86 domain-containing protein [Mariniphaga anaerophila]|uniref:DUF86 domain-containing protein n=1 Tax=Mariniphaga anaerophila TaxID=1484053 RepID=A0A831LKB8_9BACT|nr:DUF86 domain-containing protein [Mariniphaga anaerophila]
MRNKDYYLLLSILETIKKILLYTKDYNSAEDFYNSQRDFDAAMMNFIVLGESVGKLSDDLINSNQHIDWQKVYGFRNIVAHHYFGINVDIVWQIIQENLPELKKNIHQIIDSNSYQ